MYDFEAVNFPESHDTDSSDIARVWPSYFPDVELADDDRRLKLVRELCIFLLTKEGDYLLSLVKRDDGILYLPLDFHQLQRSCNVEEFYAALEVAPKEALLSMGAAVHKQVLLSRGKNQLENEEKINIRLHSHPASMIALKNLKSAYIGRLVSVRGTVVKVSTVRPLVVRMSFACGKCGTVIPRVFPDGKYSPPMVCNSHGCKSRTFFPIRSTAQPIDFQKIRVQELQRSEFHEEGRMPRTVECELTEDLVDACIPGDVVTVCGIIKVINTYMDVGGGKSKSKNQGLYYLYLEAVSIRNSKSQSAAEDLQVTNVDFRAGLLTDLYAFSPRDLEFIVRFSEEHGSNIFCQLLHSICPSIYGHELALLEAMEQQCVSVAKAGMVASLSARTSVLAAANPVGGHYDRAKTVNENLKMSATLLSRFDLVFILLDKPDELLDKRVSEHIMALHAGYAECFQAPKKLRNEIQNNGVIEMGVRSGSLVSRLRLDPVNDKDFVPLPSPLLRKYIAYARSFVFPRMSKVAAEILQKFYLQLRNHNSVADGTPITARQLESLVRLAEARARLDLREEITGQDALDVVEIMKESLYDKFVDEHGFVDFGRSGGMSQQKEAKRFLAALQKQSELHKKDCFSVSEIYSLADKIGLRVPDMDVFIENLNSNGYLLKKGPKTYQVLSSSYSKTQGSSQITRSRG
ncbi:hypothetical protein AMTRI_Chr08g206540 [Amborella trichopoda]